MTKKVNKIFLTLASFIGLGALVVIPSNNRDIVKKDSLINWYEALKSVRKFIY
ncbi:hypothetical protein [Mycoplasmopsis bovirhinis]|uniref:hypothetical protein n=1 Tax=Mycoplasmopsis bovirhinis TaxID=29553 RepID=UPI0012FD731E|nr:hypothetical protein [Mycoplasmopsis bovirhinis]